MIWLASLIVVIAVGIPLAFFVVVLVLNIISRILEVFFD